MLNEFIVVVDTVLQIQIKYIKNICNRGSYKYSKKESSYISKYTLFFIIEKIPGINDDICVFCVSCSRLTFY